jgi:uncharacterized protein (TIGR03083 family)
MTAMLRPATPIDVLSIMDQERAECVRFLASLRDEDRATPTVCEGWTVADVAVHLLGDDLFFLSRCRDGYEAPGAGPPQDLDEVVKWLDEINERWVGAGRGLSPRLVADLLEVTGRLVSEFLARVDVDAPAEVVSWAGPGKSPWWLVSAREFSERWVHHQQIRDALGRPGLNGPSFVTPILATAMRGVPPVYREVDAPEGTTIAIDVTGRAGYSWAIRRDAQDWELYEGLTRDATTRLTLAQDTAWRFLARMLPESEARPQVTIEGEQAFAEPFFDAVSAIVRPR